MELEAIHQEMLEEISDSYQKSPGFPAYDFTRAFALAVLSLDGDVEAAESRLDPDLLEGDDLDLYVYQHAGITRRQAGYAEAEMMYLGTGVITEGDAFATETGLMFYALENRTNPGQTFRARAEEPGAAWNVAIGAITVMPVQIAGVEMVSNVNAASGGADAESDEALRERFYDTLRHPSNGGNIYAYRQWALSVEGVGRAMVFPTPEGPNTVEVCIVDRNGTMPTEDLIAEVQDVIDPNHNGDGTGEAPIGAVCTVMAPEELGVSVEVTLTLADGAEQSAVQAAAVLSIRAAISAAALAGGVLRYASLADAVMVDGVADFTGLYVNGTTRSISPGDREIPVCRGVLIHYAGT